MRSRTQGKGGFRVVLPPIPVTPGASRPRSPIPGVSPPLGMFLLLFFWMFSVAFAAFAAPGGGRSVEFSSFLALIRLRAGIFGNNTVNSGQDPHLPHPKPPPPRDSPGLRLGLKKVGFGAAAAPVPLVFGKLQVCRWVRAFPHSRGDERLRNPATPRRGCGSAGGGTPEYSLKKTGFGEGFAGQNHLSRPGWGWLCHIP